MGQRWTAGDPPLAGFPPQYVRRLLFTAAALVVIALVSLFVFHSAFGLILLAIWIFLGESGIYFWWRWRGSRKVGEDGPQP